MENVTAEQVKQLQAEGKKLLVDYWATWCGPCKSLIPRLEAMESKYPDITFVKVNVDENTDSALQLGIRSVPTVMIYRGDELVNRSSGVNVESEYAKILDTL
jgi:thioredoxin